MFATRQELPTREDCAALCVKTVPSNHSVCHRRREVRSSEVARKSEVKKQRSNEVTTKTRRGLGGDWKQVIEEGNPNFERGDQERTFATPLGRRQEAWCRAKICSIVAIRQACGL